MLPMWFTLLQQVEKSLYQHDPFMHAPPPAFWTPLQAPPPLLPTPVLPRAAVAGAQPPPAAARYGSSRTQQQTAIGAHTSDFSAAAPLLPPMFLPLQPQSVDLRGAASAPSQPAVVSASSNRSKASVAPTPQPSLTASTAAAERSIPIHVRHAAPLQGGGSGEPPAPTLRIQSLPLPPAPVALQVPGMSFSAAATSSSAAGARSSSPQPLFAQTLSHISDAHSSILLSSQPLSGATVPACLRCMAPAKEALEPLPSFVPPTAPPPAFVPPASESATRSLNLLLWEMRRSNAEALPLLQRVREWEEREYAKLALKQRDEQMRQQLQALGIGKNGGKKKRSNSKPQPPPPHDAGGAATASHAATSSLPPMPSRATIVNSGTHGGYVPATAAQAAAAFASMPDRSALAAAAASTPGLSAAMSSVLSSSVARVSAPQGSTSDGRQHVDLTHDEDTPASAQHSQVTQHQSTIAPHQRHQPLPPPPYIPRSSAPLPPPPPRSPLKASKPLSGAGAGSAPSPPCTPSKRPRPPTPTAGGGVSSGSGGTGKRSRKEPMKSTFVHNYQLVNTCGFVNSRGERCTISLSDAQGRREHIRTCHEKYACRKLDCRAILDSAEEAKHHDCKQAATLVVPSTITKGKPLKK